MIERDLKNKIAWYAFLIYISMVGLMVVYFMFFEGFLDDDIRVLSPYGGRGTMYLDYMRE